jgi:choice-of-anchor B domain-containing protein
MDGPTQRPAWLARVTAEPIRGREIGPGEWRLGGGDADGGTGTSGGFEARGVTLLAWLPLNALPGDSEAGADCWGYTSPSGREYAIMCVHNGTSFLEVTDPLNPRVVGFVGGASTLWHDPTPWKAGARPSRLGARFFCDAAVIGGYCYASSDVEGGSGIQVIDLRRIDEGMVTHVKNWSAGGLRSVQTLTEDGMRLLACGSNLANGGLVVIDVSDPEAPALAGAWTGRPVGEAFPFTPVRGGWAGRDLVACFSDGPVGLTILDATDPAQMVEIAAPAGYGSLRQGWATPDHRVLYVGPEPGGPAAGAASPATRILDLSDPAAPSELGRAPTGGGASVAHHQVVAGRTLFQAHGTSGLRVCDVADPARPEEFAFFDTYPEDDGARDQGAWGVYPFFRSGTVLVSDMQRGLFVLRVDRRGDLDGDGEVGPLDLAALVGFYDAADARADIDGDRTIDACDVGRFMELWGGP